jgi:hypothetical protein
MGTPHRGLPPLTAITLPVPQREARYETLLATERSNLYNMDNTNPSLTPDRVGSVTPRTFQIEEGSDYLLEEIDQLPLTLVKNLGHGHSANVEMVRDERSGSVFARKIFRIRSSQDERRHIFENEIKIIRYVPRWSP